MSDEFKERLRAALQRYVPFRVRAFDGEDLVREIPVPQKRTKWNAVINVAVKLRWSRLELVDRSGGLLYVVESEAGQSDDPPELELAPIDAQGARDAQLLQLLITAQRAALGARSDDTRVAMDACANALRQVTESVATLVQIQQLVLQTQQQAFRAAAAAAAASAAPPSEDLESRKLLTQIAPMLVAKLMAPEPAAAPPPKPNGVKS